MRKTTATVLLLSAALLLPAALFAQDGSSDAKSPIKLGVAGPFTGPNAQFGVQIRYGVTYAAEEINAAGGINGRPVELVFEDDAAQQSEANKVALKLASNPDILAVVGHFNSSCSLAARGIYQEAGIVMFSPGSTNATVCTGYPNVFRNIFTDQFQGESIARLMKESMGLSKAAVIYENDDYGRGLYEFFRDKSAAIGLELVSEKAYDRDTTDFRPLLQAILRRKPEALLISGLYQQAALITRQARELGLTIPVIGSDGVFSDKYVELAGNASEGARVTTPFVFDDSNQRATAFKEEIKKRFGSEPDAWAVLSFDAVNIIAAAIEKSGADRTAIMTHLGAMTSAETAFDGLGGPTYFDAEGDCVKPVMIARVRDGKFVMAEEQLKPE